MTRDLEIDLRRGEECLINGDLRTHVSDLDLGRDLRENTEEVGSLQWAGGNIYRMRTIVEVPKDPLNSHRCKIKPIGKIANDQRRPKTTILHLSERGRGGVEGIEGTVNEKKGWSL